MDERRRTISSEEQMIGEALMRVSNTLEAQRLTKSLDYQEKLRSRSNIRLIIAIICLFVAMMMMVISGALLFVLWRYADPVLDTVMPFLKGMMGDFGVIWDGLVETLSYVPVMVEQLTRLLEQVIIMLEGINSIDLAGLMGMVTKMLGGLMTMVDNLVADLKPMFDTIGDMLTDIFENGLDLNQIITDLLGPDAAANISAFTQGLLQVMGNMGTQLGTLSDDLTPVVGEMGKQLVSLAEGISPVVDEMGNLLDQTSSMIGDVAAGIEGAKGEVMTQSVTDFLDSIPGLVDEGTALVGTAGSALGTIGENIDPDQLKSLITGAGDAIEGTGNALSALGDAMNQMSEDPLGFILGLLGIG